MEHQLWNYNGQLYAMVGTKPYVRRDGVTVELVVWRTHCATCGELFEVQTVDRQPKYPTRRCDQHKAQGRRVKAHALWRQPVPLAELLGDTPAVGQTKTASGRRRRSWRDPAATLTTSTTHRR